jgi:integrase/recombinase XerC
MPEPVVIARSRLASLVATGTEGVTIQPLQAFERWLERLSPHTKRAYSSDINDLAIRCDLTERQLIERLVATGPAGTNFILDTWLAELATEGLKTATRARRLSSVRALLRFLRQVGVINWTVEIRMERVEHQDMRGPNGEDWQRLLRQIDLMTDLWMRARTKAIVALLGICGLRVGEALGVSLPMDYQGERLRVLGKGHSAPEWIHLPAPVRNHIDEWIFWRGSKPGALFVAKATEASMSPLVHSSVYRQLLRLGHKISDHRSIRPHGLRHRAITAALDATGGDVRRVMRFSRHKSITTVLRYDDEREHERIASNVAELVANI